MTDDQKYERYCEYARKSGFRPQKKQMYLDYRNHVLFLAVHPLVRDCEALNFIISMEVPSRVSCDNIEGFDVIVIPYEGYYDEIVQKAIDMDALILTLEGYTKWEGDFEMEDDKGKKTSIAIYLDQLDYGPFALYDQHAIIHFKDDYFFLSNFYNCDIVYEGISYKSAEAAFQAQKCIDDNKKLEFSALSAGQAKKLGKEIELRKDWNDIRVDIMKSVVRTKFDQHPELQEQLVATGDRCLIEVNVWHDKFWGVSSGKGRNMLGRILMDLRKEYKEAEHGSD
jgi:ribA/ribD-fused uncharacterized protein